jgi:hypothetical protein
MSVVHVLSFLSVFGSALFVGTTCWVLVVTMPALRRMSEAESVRMHQVQLDELPDHFFPLLVPFVNLTALGVLIAHWHPSSWAFVLESVGLGLMLVVTAVTLLVNVPIKRTIRDWSVEQIPSGYAELRRRWDRFHLLRTVLGGFALGCFLAAALAL